MPFRLYEVPGAERNWIVAASIVRLVQAGPLKKPSQQEIEMTHDNAKEGRSVWYWITLAIMFAAFFAAALS
jgi:hypothetical protein